MNNPSQTSPGVIAGAMRTKTMLQSLNLLSANEQGNTLGRQPPASNSLPTPDQFNESWRGSLGALLGYARTAGADFCEIFLEKRNYQSLMVENGRVTSVSPQLLAGAGVRVFRGKEDCYVSTNNLSPAGIFWALDKALTILGFAPPSPARIHVDVSLEPLRDYTSLGQKHKWLDMCPALEESVLCLTDFNTALKLKSTKAESVVTSCFRDFQEVLVASSDGVFATDMRLNQSFVAQLSCVDGANRASLAERLGSSGDPDFLRKIQDKAVIDPLTESAGKMLYAKYVESGNYPIIMANKFGGVIFHEACGHLLETTQIEKKTTPFLEKKGQPIAHTAVTAWDEGHQPDAFGTISMDDEGMPSQSTLLIEDGILRNFLSDRAGHLRTGEQRTGSGRRQNYTFPAASRMRNTYIAAGNYTPNQLTESIENGLYCKRMGGGSVGATGEFNFAVTECYLIKNGRVTEPVKGATLIGQAKDILMNISMCANDTELAAGFCGSVSGTVYVTVGQPHIKVDAITVGGR